MHKERTSPSALGYYHFPETMTDEEAFNELKECMIKAHQEEIDRLEKSLKKLKELTWSET